MILERGKVIAYGEKSDVCDRPTSIEAARLTGCKNFSRAEKNRRSHSQSNRLELHFRIR